MPFSAEQFFEVFRRYNEAVWPAQVLLLAGGLVTVVLAFRPAAGRAASAILAFLWLWTGAVYHIGFFREINPVAVVFGVVFALQAGFFAWTGVLRGGLTFHPERSARGVAGGFLILYALAIYPIVGALIGHRYPAAPTFGLPCPTTIFTLGVLLWARPPVSWWLIVVPAFWSGVGTIGALQLRVPEDFGLTVAAVVAISFMLFGRRTTAVTTSEHPVPQHVA